ncbi:MAG: methyltransferase domain-containing protein [Planctomycetes bacterium]|nr:methyltransferase domain-containing protein [Planctomycetota bacterium]
MSKVVETFDRWAEEGRDAELEREHSDVARQVIAAMQLRPGERVLDLGCGNGWATRLIAQASPGVQAIGVDAAPKMIARAEALHSLTIRARYELGTFEKLDFKDGHFDRVFSMEALYYATDLAQAIRECFRVLKPGGSVETLVDYYAESTASEPWAGVMGLALQRLSESGWKRAFEQAGFVAVTTVRVIDSRGPGAAHDFRADECEPTHAAKRALHAAGTLRVRAEKAQ